MALSVNWGVLSVGILTIRALLSGVYPDFGNSDILNTKYLGFLDSEAYLWFRVDVFHLSTWPPRVPYLDLPM